MPGSAPSIARRCLHGVAVLLGVSIATFAVAHATGDPVALLISPSASLAARTQMRTHLGLDQPVIAQYLLFLRHAMAGDFGQSFIYRQAVATLVLQRLPATLLLAGTAFALALGISIPLGTLAAARGGIAAFLLQLFSIIGLAVPSFWLGLMLVLVVSVWLRLLPVDGFGGISHLVLPALTLSLQSIARLGRLVAAGLRDVLRADYIRTARAKGLRERRVIWVHALRNVLVPVVTMAGLELGDLISSAVVVEVVFAWPGIGRLAVMALSQRDFPLLQGTVFIAGLCFVLINLLADILCARIDPRIRLA
jgi:ABC-type dipeptide/oligopeptide/nickel transport system permease component